LSAFANSRRTSKEFRGVFLGIIHRFRVIFQPVYALKGRILAGLENWPDSLAFYQDLTLRLQSQQPRHFFEFAFVLDRLYSLQQTLVSLSRSGRKISARALLNVAPPPALPTVLAGESEELRSSEQGQTNSLGVKPPPVPTLPTVMPPKTSVSSFPSSSSALVSLHPSAPAVVADAADLPPETRQTIREALRAPLVTPEQIGWAVLHFLSYMERQCVVPDDVAKRMHLPATSQVKAWLSRHPREAAQFEYLRDLFDRYSSSGGEHWKQALQKYERLQSLP